MNNKIKTLERSISLLEVGIRDKHSQIRDTINYMLRSQLEEKKRVTRNKQEPMGKTIHTKAKTTQSKPSK